MAKKITSADLEERLEKHEVVELEGVEIKGDLEFELSAAGGVAVPPSVLQQALQSVLGVQSLAQVAQAALQSVLGGGVQAGTGETETARKIEAQELATARFEVAKAKWVGKVEEVTLGATSSDGGTREKVVKIGGEKSLPFYNFDHKMPHAPVISVDCFDIPIPLAKAVRGHYEDVMQDPGEWAKKNVREFGADMVTIHLISTDPLINDTPAREAAKTVEEVLQAVKVPIVIGGSGNPEKDPAVLEAAAEAAEGERCLIASANLNMDYKRIANAAKEHGHTILSWTQLDINAQKTLNRYLFKLGVPREDIVIDPTTAALGYGLDYAFTNIERMRISALKGDTDLAFPISCGITNAWGAREAWMKNSPIAEDSDWGPAAYRGPLYEIMTGLTLGVAGGDLFMMMHPKAAAAVKRVTQMLFGAAAKEGAEAGAEEEGRKIKVEDWVSWGGR
ncbi:CO dehydrogenase/acetyl-CoA synthase subunit delta [ANME-1 cluster archaeon ex4572_4]|nr:CO dehydrogenase/acetyl-CoA synthase subunit delta [Methanophagales archaeon]OYT66949.1 MAG: CO dehydrogenase/acetyl-CoA synthase subunit delta [ANME-1 cluster archaeon ex4572_4]HDN68471.1 CO dehydrogenase/acetyl-CoA synthase subunit delta [Methanomicrobia archaeon]